MNTRAKENTRRAVQLRYHNALSSINYECTILCHIRDRSQKDILYDSIKIFMIWICAIELQLCLQRNTISQASFQTLFYRIARSINVIVKKLQNKVVSCVCDWEIFSKHLVQSVILSLFSRCIQLKEIFK